MDQKEKICAYICTLALCCVSHVSGFYHITSASDRVYEGQEIRITCTTSDRNNDDHELISQNLDRHIVWYRGNVSKEQPIDQLQDARISMETQIEDSQDFDVVATLSISPATPADAGNYTCTRKDRDSDWNKRLENGRQVVITVQTPLPSTEAMFIPCGDGHPCVNGTCRPSNTTSGFLCDCIKGYSGEYCDQKTAETNHVTKPWIEPQTSFLDVVTVVTTIENNYAAYGGRQSALAITIPIVGVMILVGVIVSFFVIKRLTRRHIDNMSDANPPTPQAGCTNCKLQITTPCDAWC